MLRLLRQPYPFAYEPRSNLVIVLLVSTFIYLFLLMVQPYDLSALSPDILNRVALGYGCVTMFCSIVQLFVWPVIFPDHYKEDNWTVGKELAQVAYLLLFIGLMNFLYGELIGFDVFDQSNSLVGRLFMSIIATLLIGMIPAGTVITINFFRLRSKYTKGASSLNKHMEARRLVQPEHDKRIEISSDQEADPVRFDPDDLILVQASGNYVEFFIHENGNIRKTVSRNTLLKVEDQLKDQKFFFRTHRTFLVNLKAIQKSEGNAQGYQLTLQGIEQKVPVSRKNIPAFSEVMNSMTV